MLKDNMQFTAGNEENKRDKVMTPTGDKTVKSLDETDPLAAIEEENI